MEREREREREKKTENNIEITRERESGRHIVCIFTDLKSAWDRDNGENNSNNNGNTQQYEHIAETNTMQTPGTHFQSSGKRTMVHKKSEHQVEQRNRTT